MLIARISSDHICAIRLKVDIDGPMLTIIGVYMPCSNKGIECYRQHMLELERVISESSLVGTVITLGVMLIWGVWVGVGEVGIQIFKE